MPAGRKAQPITQIVLKLTSKDSDLIRFCEYYKSECGRKAGEKKLRGQGVLDKGIDGDYSKFIKDELNNAIQAGVLSAEFVDYAEKSKSWSSGGRVADPVAKKILDLAKSDPQLMELLKKKGVVIP